MYRLLFLGLLVSSSAFAQTQADRDARYGPTYWEVREAQMREESQAISLQNRENLSRSIEVDSIERTYQAEQAENRLNANTHAPGGYIPNDEYNDYLDKLDSQ